MATVLYVWINKERYELCETWTDVWRLKYYDDRCSLGEFNAWSLDYWCKKGVIESEEEKKTKGS